MTAAAHVLRTVVADVRRIVRVRGARLVEQLAVVTRAGIGIADHGTDRRAASHILQQSADKLDLIRLSAGSSKRIPPRGATHHKITKCLAIHRKSGGEPVDHHTDRFGVGLTENTDL